jgi:hypothetical protein
MFSIPLSSRHCSAQSLSSHSSACNVTNIEHIDILQYLFITVRSCDPEINGNIDDENSFLHS